MNADEAEIAKHDASIIREDWNSLCKRINADQNRLPAALKMLLE